MKKKILAAVLAAAMVMSMTGVSAAAKKQSKRVKERPLFTELPDIVKKWEMQD